MKVKNMKEEKKSEQMKTFIILKNVDNLIPINFYGALQFFNLFSFDTVYSMCCILLEEV